MTQGPGEQGPENVSPVPPDGFASVGFAMDPRTVVLIVSGFLTILLAALAALLPVPYVILSPGPVFNTLGSVEGKALISVSGHPTYQPKGQLDLTTVSVRGAPGDRVDLLSVLRGWVNGSTEVVPQDVLYPPGRTEEEEEQAGQAQMVDSQESATAAALTALGIEVPMTITVAAEDAGTPGAKVLRGGDVIRGVGERAIQDLDDLRDSLDGVAAGQEVAVGVLRANRVRTVRVPTSRDDQGRTVLGVYVIPSYRFPFTVNISIDNVGGPSAGAMFALGIVDMLTAGDLTGGKAIAGTGSIDPDGAVGPIGGIRQKLIGARRSGARWFLAPRDNCEEVRGHVPGGLRVVAVSTLQEALTAVKGIAAGDTATLPGCAVPAG